MKLSNYAELSTGLVLEVAATRQIKTRRWNAC
jgi:hypothetical protein